jgi:hypothetical protein
MAEPTIEQVFGANTTQDSVRVTIAKADFPTQGLTATASNNAEGILAYILLQSATVLTEQNRLTDLANRNIAVTYSGQDLVDQGGGNVYRRDTYQVSLYTPTTIQAIDPDNY